MSKVEGNKSILLSFDKDTLIDVKKILFKNNISIQQFVSHVFHLLILSDNNAIKILEETIKQNEKELDKVKMDEIMKISPTALYEMFEREEKNK